MRTHTRDRGCLFGGNSLIFEPVNLGCEQFQLGSGLCDGIGIAGARCR